MPELQAAKSEDLRPLITGTWSEVRWIADRLPNQNVTVSALGEDATRALDANQLLEQRPRQDEAGP